MKSIHYRCDTTKQCRAICGLTEADKTHSMTETTAKTLSVPEAGWEYFRLRRNASYDAAKRGEIPTIRFGKILRVPIVALEAMLRSPIKPDAG